MRPLGLSEVILYVKDLPLVAAFYRDQLGLTQTYPEPEADLAGTQWATFEAGPITLALHGEGEGDGAGENGPTLVFGVSDLDAAHADLTARGVELQPIEELQPGLRLAYGEDPEGFGFYLQEEAE